MATKLLGARKIILARRVESCARILALLESGPLTTNQIVADLKQGNSTVRTYLKYMSCTKMLIHVSPRRSRMRADTWALGPGPVEVSDECGDQLQVVTPARQIGMQRDPLVAALFGAPA